MSTRERYHVKPDGVPPSLVYMQECQVEGATHTTGTDILPYKQASDNRQHHQQQASGMMALAAALTQIVASIDQASGHNRESLERVESAVSWIGEQL